MAIPDGKQPVNLHNEIGKMRTEIAALHQVIADLVADEIFYTFTDNDRRFQARGFILGKIRPDCTADIICFHPRWSGGMNQIDDAPMGREHGQWWPRLILEEALEAATKALQNKAEEKEALENGAAGTRRTAAINRS